MLTNGIRINSKILTRSQLIILSIILYCLFALKRIKFFGAGTINGVALNNAIWLFPIILIVKYVLTIKKYLINKNIKLYDKYLPMLYILLFIVVTCGGFKIESISQYIYSILQLFVPLMFIFSIKIEDIYKIDNFIKIIVVVGFIYSILAIITSMNYGELMSLMGNETNQQYNGQYRASLMIGSSITVSYYLNITLPLNFYLFYNEDNITWRRLGFIAILFNILATLILLSRLSFIVSLTIVYYYLFFVKKRKYNYKSKFIFILSIICIFIYALNQFDIQRLFMGFKDSSTLERMDALNLGLYIFKNNILIGSGLGRYFERAYSNRIISVDGIIGLVDPHNSYILAVSELGIIGSIILSVIFIRIIKCFTYINNPILRKTSYITIIAYFLGAIGGSQLFNEIIFSTILWIYLSIYMAIGKKDYYKKYMT